MILLFNKEIDQVNIQYKKLEEKTYKTIIKQNKENDKN